MLKKPAKCVKMAPKWLYSRLTEQNESLVTPVMFITSDSNFQCLSIYIQSCQKLRKNQKLKHLSELEDRTTLNRRRNAVMVGSPGKKVGQTRNISGSLEKCLCGR